MFCSSEDHWRTDGCSAAGAEAGRILLLPRRLSPSRDGFSVRDVRALQHNLRVMLVTDSWTVIIASLLRSSQDEREARQQELFFRHRCSRAEDTLYIQDSSQCGTQRERSRRFMNLEYNAVTSRESRHAIGCGSGWWCCS